MYARLSIFEGLLERKTKRRWSILVYPFHYGLGMVGLMWKIFRIEAGTNKKLVVADSSRRDTTSRLDDQYQVRDRFLVKY